MSEYLTNKVSFEDLIKLAKNSEDTYQARGFDPEKTMNFSENKKKIVAAIKELEEDGENLTAMNIVIKTNLSFQHIKIINKTLNLGVYDFNLHHEAIIKTEKINKAIILLIATNKKITSSLISRLTGINQGSVIYLRDKYWSKPFIENYIKECTLSRSKGEKKFTISKYTQKEYLQFYKMINDSGVLYSYEDSKSLIINQELIDEVKLITDELFNTPIEEDESLTIALKERNANEEIFKLDKELENNLYNFNDELKSNQLILWNHNREENIKIFSIFDLTNSSNLNNYSSA